MTTLATAAQAIADSACVQVQPQRIYADVEFNPDSLPAEFKQAYARSPRKALESFVRAFNLRTRNYHRATSYSCTTSHASFKHLSPADADVLAADMQQILAETLTALPLAA
jgi:hypothetical protein